MAPSLLAVVQVLQHTGACSLQPAQGRAGSLLQELQQEGQQLLSQGSWLCEHIGFILLVQAGRAVGSSGDIKPLATQCSPLPDPCRGLHSRVSLHDGPEVGLGQVL